MLRRASSRFADASGFGGLLRRRALESSTQFVTFAREFPSTELGATTDRHVKDVVSLDGRELERISDKAFHGISPVVASSDLSVNLGAVVAQGAKQAFDDLESSLLVGGQASTSHGDGSIAQVSRNRSLSWNLSFGDLEGAPHGVRYQRRHLLDRSSHTTLCHELLSDHPHQVAEHPLLLLAKHGQHAMSGCRHHRGTASPCFPRRAVTRTDHSFALTLEPRDPAGRMLLKARPTIRRRRASGRYGRHLLGIGLTLSPADAVSLSN